jgi:hypothetical protein
MPEQVIILNNAADIGEFWRKLKQPDLILMRPGPTGTAGAAKPTATAPKSSVVSSVKVRGRVDDEMADLQLELDIDLLDQGPAWVPVGLDHQVLTSAREMDRDLELRTVAQDRWEVRLEGKRTHPIRIDVKVPVQATPQRRQLQFEIPVAPSTSLEIDIPRAVDEVRLGAGEAIGRTPLPAGKGTRISGFLTPRPRLRLEWSDSGESGSQPSPLLAAQGEIEIEVDADAVTTRSTWMVRCVRGIARKLEFGLDAQDIVARVELDEQSLVAGIEHDVLTVPLPEPLRPGASRRLTLETRRAFAPSATRTFTFAGFPLSGAGEQSGAIAITQAANLWIDVRASRAVRRIDPRYLPPGLRLRPGMRMAYQFIEQPLALKLGVEASPPLFRSESRARLSVRADLLENQTRIDVERVRGQLFEVQVAVPPDLQLVSVGPPDLVDSSALVDGEPPAGRSASGPSGKVLKIGLTFLGRDQKSISLNLVGRQRLAGVGDVELGLFSLIGPVSGENLYQVYTAPDLGFEAVETAGQPGSTDSTFFTREAAETPAFSGESLPARPPALMLRSKEGQTSVRGRLVRHGLSIVHETRLSGRVSRRGIDVRQDTSLQVRHGSVGSLIVEVPDACAESWEVQAREAVRREAVGAVEGGAGRKRYRLTFDPPISDRSSLQFRFQLPLPQAPADSGEVKGLIPRFVLEEGESRATWVDLSAEPGIRVSVNDPCWTMVDAGDRPRSEDEPRGQYRLVAADDKGQGLPFSITALEQVAMPPLVVTRALLRTTIGSDDTSRTRARYWIENHPSQIAFTLPEGASWVRARIDGRSADSVEFDPVASCYRMGLPTDKQSRPVLLELEYQLSKASPNHGCLPPELLDGAVAMETRWVLQIPWSLAVIGVPDGWADENQWYWDMYVWKRKPWKSNSTLMVWVTGSTSQSGREDGVIEENQDDSHAYLFARTGQPVPLRLWVASRAWTMGICSGVVLALGFSLMFSRVRFRRIWIGVAAFCLLGSLLVHPSAVLLVLQSSISGAVLALLGLAIQKLIDRRGTPTTAPATQAPTASSSSGLSAAPPASAGVGSDDSTAIRVRTPSTLDHVAAPLVVVSDQPSATGSSFEPYG